MPTTKDIYTADKQTVHNGDRVFNYYDLEWGHIVSEPDQEGWFEFQPESDDETRSKARSKALNGERIATADPRDTNPNWPMR